MGKAVKIKLQGLEQLVQEQLDAHHIEEQPSLWNSPVFVVKKTSGGGKSSVQYGVCEDLLEMAAVLSY